MALAALKDELVIWDAALEAFISDDFDGALGLFEVTTSFQRQNLYILTSAVIFRKFQIISRL